LHRRLQRHGISRVPDGASAGKNEIEHPLTKVNHPWTNGQVERMNRTIKESAPSGVITMKRISSFTKST
jgi:hypothetical protein